MPIHRQDHNINLDIGLSQVSSNIYRSFAIENDSVHIVCHVPNCKAARVLQTTPLLVPAFIHRLRLSSDDRANYHELHKITRFKIYTISFSEASRYLIETNVFWTVAINMLKLANIDKLLVTYQLTRLIVPPL